MKKNMLITLLLVAAATGFAEPQTTCPIMGGKINEKLYADIEGYRIYVCCKPCAAKIKADPQAVIKKMKAAGIELERTPEK